MNIRLTTDPSRVCWDELARLYELAPLGNTRAPDKIELAFRNSLLKVFAFDADRLVGAGAMTQRAPLVITDRIDAAFTLNQIETDRGRHHRQRRALC